MLIDRMRHGASKIIEVTKIRALPNVHPPIPSSKMCEGPIENYAILVCILG